MPAETISVDPSLGKITAHCSEPRADSHYVWIFKQWHLAPSVNTKESPAPQTYPQAENQTSLFKQLDQWISTGKIKEIVAEGCTGTLDEHSTASFNGWRISDLTPLSSKAGYPEILSSVPLKLEAKYGSSISTICGDDEALVRENNLAFSEARAALGFLTRLIEFKNDAARGQPYLDGVIQAYKMSTSTTSAQAIERMKVELKAAIERAQQAIAKRNLHLVEAIKKASHKDVAVVYGGIHAAGIVKLLNSAGQGCSVIEPHGYEQDEEKLLDTLQRAVNEL